MMFSIATEKRIKNLSFRPTRLVTPVLPVEIQNHDNDLTGFIGKILSTSIGGRHADKHRSLKDPGMTLVVSLC